MCQVLIDIPKAVMYDTHMDESATATFAKRMVALGYYTQNSISIGYCAKIAGMTEEEFILFLGQNHVSIFNYADEEELLKDVANA